VTIPSTLSLEPVYLKLCPSKDLEIKLKQSMVMVTNFIENMESVTQRYSSFEQIESDVKDIMNHLEREILGECLGNMTFIQKSLLRMVGLIVTYFVRKNLI
jgi:hypothetical protein